jgi:hypothetical protein
MRPATFGITTGSPVSGTRQRRRRAWSGYAAAAVALAFYLFLPELPRWSASVRSILAASGNTWPSNPGGSTSLHAEQATSAAAFVDSIGVQTHISYVDTPYANWPRVLEELDRLGVHHIRDALPLTPTFVSRHRQLAESGMRCTCGFAFDKSLTSATIVEAARAASDVEALEAPNECDAGTNCGGGGSLGITNVTASLPVLASAARELQVPLVGPSFTTQQAYASAGSIAQWITYNNLHVYFGGRNPGTEGWGAGDTQGHRYGSFAWWLDQGNVDAPGRPSEITETGYEAFDHPDRPGSVPVDVESSYLLRTLLLAWNHDVNRTFIYELLDEFPDSGYGLLRHDLTEKPAFTALRNLLSILNDSSRPKTSGRLMLSIDQKDTSVSHTIFAKGDGSFDLVLWLERSRYNSDTRMISPVLSEPAHLQLESRFGVAQIVSFNEDGSTQNRVLSTKPSLLTVDVNDRLTVVHIVEH